MPTEIGGGYFADTVGDILRENPQLPGEGVADAPIERVLPARHPDQPEFPSPGIYFGLEESVYHSINAFSASLAKKMSISTMDAWSCSPLNLDRDEVDEDTTFKTLGRAYHVRICEGAVEYARRYTVALDKGDFPDILETTDDIKSALIEAGENPVSRIPTGLIKVHPKTGKETPMTRAAKKDDWIAQLLEVSPDAQIWDAMVAAHEAEHVGTIMISAKQHRRIEIAAKMIEGDPQLSKAFSGGYAEVSIFFYDERTGCPCKARLDYLKLQAFIDLKSMSNPMGRPISRAIDFTIASQKHYIAVMHYRQAIEAAKAMIKVGGRDAVYRCDTANDFADAGLVDSLVIDREAWCAKLATQKEAPTALYVYQQTGPAPVTRGRIMTIGTVATITDSYLQAWKKLYVECTKTWGVDPWIDVAPIEETVDESIPMSATDLGE